MRGNVVEYIEGNKKLYNDDEIYIRDNLGTRRNITPDWSVKSASYIIYQDNGTIKAVNGTTGVVDYSGSDASTVIQSALNGLTAGRTWKEKVIVRGNFTITNTISIPSYTILEIQGKLTLANGTNTHSVKNSDQSNGNNDIEIFGLELDGNKANQSGAQPLSHGIYFVKVSNFTIHDCYIHDTFTDGIKLDTCHEGIIINIEGYNGGSSNDGELTGVSNSYQISILGCIARSYVGDGFAISDGNYEISIIGCHAISNGYSGIGLGNLTAIENIIVKDCVLRDNGANGISMVKVSYSIIEGNIIIGHTIDGNAGIKLFGTGTGCFGNSISGNYIENNDRGIYLIKTSYRNSIIGNIITTSTKQGIALENYVYECSIVGNVSYGNTIDGIVLYGDGADGCNRNTISSNICNGNTGNGIFIYRGRDNILSSNICNGNVLNGIKIADDGSLASLRNIVNNNLMTTNSNWGILQQNSGDYSTIIGNNIITNTSGNMSLTGSNNRVKDNNGYISDPIPSDLEKIASANVRNSHNAEASTAVTSYTKVKTITLTNGLLGVWRVLFDLKSGTAPNSVAGKVYRNGVALGTEQTDVTGGYVTKSEDLTQDCQPGDTIELWLKAHASATAYAQNFQLAYDDSPTVTVASANS